MKKYYYGIALVALALLLSACGSDDSNHDGSGSDEQLRRSLIVYMAAQNSLGDAKAHKLDSAEIVNGFSIHNNSRDNIFLFIDDASLPRIYRIYRYRNRTIVDKVTAWADDACSSDPATLCQVIQNVKENYPAQSYGLVMWSHGSGWLPSESVVNTLKSKICSFGVDVGPDGDMATDRNEFGTTAPQMDIADMAEGIRQSGVHFDYIFFDACLMQNIEVAYELKDVADYVIGNASSTTAYGGYYTHLVPDGLFGYPIDDAKAQAIATRYFNDVTSDHSLAKYYGDTGDVISVIKTSQLANLANVTATMLAKYVATKHEIWLYGVQAYSSPELYDAPEYCDMGSLMHSLLSDEDYQTWLLVAQKAVILHHQSPKFILGVERGEYVFKLLSDPDHVLGVSMYVPQNRYDGNHLYTNFNSGFQDTRWYQDAGWSQTGW